MLAELEHSISVPRRWAHLGPAARRRTSTRGVEGNVADPGGDLPTGHCRAPSLRMGLQGEAQHTSPGSSADRAVSQAAPVVCSEVLEPDTPGGFRPGCPLSNATMELASFASRQPGKTHPLWVLRSQFNSLLEQNGVAAGRSAPWTRTTVENRSSRNSPSFAVALNCGIGSSSSKVDVKAFERLQIVLGRSSFVLRPRSTSPAQSGQSVSEL